MEQIQIIDVFAKILILHQTVGEKPLNQLPDGIWKYELPDNWYLVVNGNDGICNHTPPESMSASISPFHAAVWFNGFLAGHFHPGGGLIAAGTVANEESLLKVLDQAIEQATRQTHPGTAS